ncbi:PKD domain-containing protein, partial [Actinokineospora sp.]|uniref:PKD domain-containing protein n=1 Tax=Actinokineospora sp. TaxID=1872133 RepID=UPI003D6A1025
ASFVTTLQFQRAALAQALAAGAIQVALGDLAGTMGGVDSILSGLARHGADVLLDPNSHVSVPNEPARFALVVRNIGTQTTTYDLSVQGLPASVTSQLSQSSVTLAPGQSSSQLAGGNLIVTLTQTSTTAIVPVDFSVRVTPQPAPDVARTVTGSLTVRAELVAVTAVTATPPFTAAGGLVDVIVRVLNVVNQPRDVSLSLVVRDPAGQPVLTLNRPLSLTLLSSLATVTFAGIDTTGFAPGSYTIEVSVKNAAGEPLPGATGQGTLLVGSPVTASLSVDPTLTPPGAPVVTATLRIDAQNTFASPFTVVGQLPGVGHSVAVKDDIAYLCGANGIGIVDVSDATNPTLLSSFGSDRVSGSAFTVCKVDGDRLIVRTFPPPGYPFTLMVYSIATPTAPVFQGSTSVDFPVLNDLFVVGSTVFSTQAEFCFFFGSNDIFKQFGDLIAVDISDPTQPVLADVLFDMTPLTNFFGCVGRGGNSNTWQIAQADAQTLYVGSSTATESDTTGIGRILVVDISTPTNLSLVRELQVPGTTHVVGIAIDGTRAVAVGSSGGWNDRGTDLGLTGKLIVVTLDVSDPRNPQIVTTRTLDRASRGMHFVQAAGGGRFVTSSLGAEGDTPRVLVIDASDPANPFASQGDAPGDIPIFNVRNGLAYGASASGLFIFQLADAPGIPITAQVQIPKATGVSLVANSFNVAPDEIVTGPQFDTLIWNRGLAAGSTSFTFTWREQVANLQPGDARDVTLDATVDFAVGSTPGHIPLPPATVSAAQILALAPPTRTANPNAPATYTITVTNPSGSSVNYALGAHGVPPDWVSFDSTSALVAPHGSVERTLTLRSDAQAVLGSYGFAVSAQASGVEGSVLGTLVLDGEPVTADGVARGVVVGLDPSQATAGQGTPALFTLRVTNVGSVSDTYAITVAAPPGFTTTATLTSVEVPVGIGNFRDIQLAVVPPPGTPVGNAGISARATSTADATISAEAPGTVSIVAVGVAVSLSPPAGAPGSTFQMTVRNTGAVMETFDLSLVGPAGVASTLGAPSVTLAPGASQVVSVNVGPIGFATPGALNLTGLATARSNTAVKGSATARVTIGETAGITAGFDPALVTLAAPGGAVFLLQVHSTGNREDSYQASIVATSGPISASLSDLDGLPVQNVPLFRIPGLATAALFLDATLESGGQGTVTVRVQSLTDQSVVAEAMATLRSQGTNTPPTADAGADQQVAFGTMVVLDGTASHDPDGAPEPLTFAWTFVSTPPGSGLDDAQIAGAATAQPSFEPDVRGDYLLRLTVSDGEASASDEVLVKVVSNAPVAIAGRDRNVATGTPATLDGSDSFDPDGDLLTYEWSFQSVPAGSGLTSETITGRTRPDPSFIPDVAGAYVLKLVVRDQEATSEPSLMTVRAWAANVPPNAHAGPDRHVVLNASAALDGRATEDPDGGPAPLTFAWTVVAAPAGSQITNGSLSGANQAQAGFVPDVAGDYRIALRVGDGEAFSEDEVLITAQAENVAPNADAGPNVDAVVGVALTLNGWASRDPDGGPAPLTYRWRFVSLPAGSALGNAQIADAEKALAQFTPDVAGPYVLELTVFDGAAGDFDNVLVVARAPGVPTCLGRPATIFVRDGIIVGGPDAGRRFNGILRGTPGPDVIVGTPGDDRIDAGAGDDAICGLGGND